MKIFFLGTRSAYPTNKKSVSSLAIQHEDGQVWIFDCGEGTQVQLQKVPVSRQKITKIFITHLHGDHLFGLPGLLCTISMSMTDEEGDNSKKNNVVDIYGPKGLSRFLYTTLSLAHAPLSFQFKVHELEPIDAQFPDDYDRTIDHSALESCHASQLPGELIQPSLDQHKHAYWPVLKNEYFEIKAGWIFHGVPSYGYMIKEQDKTGRLLTDKLQEYGIKPGPDYGILKSGKSITAPSGEEITPSMVIGPPKKGRIVLILGDCSDATSFLPCVKNCDVLIHEATHDDILLEKAKLFGHSTPSIAAQVATRVGATTLLLNHFSQRYSEPSPDDDPEKVTTKILEEQANNALKGSNITAICSEDLFCFEVKRREQ